MNCEDGDFLRPIEFKFVAIRSSTWAQTDQKQTRSPDIGMRSGKTNAVLAGRARRRRPWGHRKVMGQLGQRPCQRAECSLTFTPANGTFESSDLWDLVSEVRGRSEETSSCLNSHWACFTVTPTRNRCVSESWERLSNRLRDATSNCSHRADELLRGNISPLQIRHTTSSGIATSSSSTTSGCC